MVGWIRMWRARISAGCARSTWMMWKPNSVRTTSEMAPGLRRNATSSNSLTITPRRNHPSAPPCSRETLSAEYCFATSANRAPPARRSAATRESPSCSARALAAESAFGTITIWRKEMAAGRLGCCARFASQNARISASDGGIGRSFPFCFSPSISRCCRIARRCWSASQRRHSSSDTKPAARSCAWNSGVEVNCLRTFCTVCSTASCTSWSVTLMVVSRSPCCTSSSPSTICDRICRRAASRAAESSGTFAPCDCARRQILSQMVDEELLVQQAERDTTIKVTDQEVQDAVEQTVQNVRKQFTSTPEFQTQLRAAGFVSEEEGRRWLADQQRRAILQQRLIEGLQQKGKLRPIPPSDAEMRASWGSHRAQPPQPPEPRPRPQLLTVSQ